MEQILKQLKEKKVELEKVYETKTMEARDAQVKLESVINTIEIFENMGTGIDKDSKTVTPTEKKPTVIPYDGEVYRYDLNGNFIRWYKTKEDAMTSLCAELGESKIIGHSAIGYCCTGTYNIVSPKSNHHRYKKNLWFNRMLSEAEIEDYRKRGVIL